MMKKLFFLLVLIPVGFMESIGQSYYEIKQAVEFFNSNQLQRGDRKYELTLADIKGSPYLNDEFIEGAVFTTSKTQYVGVPLRYNIFNDQVEFRSPDGLVQALAAPEVVEKIEMGELLLEFIPYINVKKIRRGFFTVLEKGNVSLYARHRVVFERAKEPGAYQDAEPARFVKRADEYFLRVGMEPAQIVAKIKDLQSIFPEHKQEVSDFIKKNEVKSNHSETLKELVQYYNSL
jgi:hypothetical protein